MRSRLTSAAIVLTVLLALSAGLSTAQGPAPQGAGQPEAMLGSAFTYQGQLKKDGALVDGICSMVFALYNDGAAGNLVGGPITTTVTVAGGLFTVALDFGGGIFTGDARWLEVAAQCPGDAGFNTLSPRQALTAAPYALSLRPGAQIAGDLASDTVLSAYNTATSGESYGVYGRSNSAGGYGVFGRAGAAAGATYGVYGRADSTAGTGVRGQATATSGSTYGVYGYSESPDGRGVAGYAAATSGDARGVYGRSESTVGYGVFGWATAATGYGSGVYGTASSADGCGVTGSNAGGTGVSGYTTTGTGVYGHTDGNGVAIKAEGQVGGNLIEAWHGPMFSDLEFYVADNGNVYADGSYLNPAAGYAEMMPGAAGLEAGDVLVVGLDGTLARCTAAYQPTVVGVYAPQAGFIGGAVEGATGQVPLAVVGVVTVKVSAENGPIAAGDLLVAADTAGHAMRASADPALGTVIGKALEGLDTGTGTILMLVMLR